MLASKGCPSSQITKNKHQRAPVRIIYVGKKEREKFAKEEESAEGSVEELI